MGRRVQWGVGQAELAFQILVQTKRYVSCESQHDFEISRIQSQDGEICATLWDKKGAAVVNVYGYENSKLYSNKGEWFFNELTNVLNHIDTVNEDVPKISWTDEKFRNSINSLIETGQYKEIRSSDDKSDIELMSEDGIRSHIQINDKGVHIVGIDSSKYSDFVKKKLLYDLAQAYESVQAKPYDSVHLDEKDEDVQSDDEDATESDADSSKASPTPAKVDSAPANARPVSTAVNARVVSQESIDWLRQGLSSFAKASRSRIVKVTGRLMSLSLHIYVAAAIVLAMSLFIGGMEYGYWNRNPVEQPEYKSMIDGKDSQIASLEEKISNLQKENDDLRPYKDSYDEKKDELDKQKKNQDQKESNLDQRQDELNQKASELNQKSADLDKRSSDLDARESEIQSQSSSPQPSSGHSGNSDSTSTGGAYYKNCAAARRAGAAPLYRGQPGYRSALDADGDGIACEWS